MKNIYIVRHAKSSWLHPDLQDHQRPLNQRGLRDAPIMAQRLYDYATAQQKLPQLFITSHAVRALSTAQTFAQPFADSIPPLQIDQRIYDGHLAQNNLFQILHDCPDHLQNIAIFGHNPAFTDFLNFFTPLDNLPTAGIALISFDIPTWRAASQSNGQLLWLSFPKS